MDTRFKNTDFFIEDIDESVKDLTVNDTSVSHFPANTDFFIENIDNNEIEICTDRGITPSTVSVVPANTDFFIVNIDTNVKKIATDLSITPSSVSKSPANTDFFIENIYFNLILICEELNIEPYEITVTPTNTDFFIEAIAENVEKIMEAQTEIHVSGTFIHAVLSADSEISDYELDGNATQDGTPTPDAPVAINTVTGEQVVKVEGKNLFNPNIITENYDFTYDASTGYLTGKTGKWTSYTIFENATNPAIMTATFEQPVGQGAGLGIQFNYADGTHNNVYPWNYSTQDKVVVTSNKPVVSIQSIVGSATNNVSYRIQLELGSTATAYEPYQGNSQEINLGKNLFDPTVYEEGYLATNGGVSSPTSNEERTSGFIKVYPNTTYTFEIYETTTSFTEWLAYCEYTAPSHSAFISPRYVKTGADPATGFYTFTTSSTAQYIRVSGRNMKKATKFQVAMGGRTDYAPYFTPIELCKIGTYQDKIYKDESKWYIEKQVGKVVLTGADTEGWNTATNSPYYAFYTTVLASLGFVDKICDNFTYENISWRNATTPILCENSTPTKLLIFAGFTDITNVTAWKTWLSTHPTTVYYALATPTTTEITDDTLLAELNAIYDIELKEGVVNIFLTATSPNLPAIIKATIIPKE